MSRYAAVPCLFLLWASPTFADSFRVTIKKVEGTKITMTKFTSDAGKGEEVILTAADSCKVFTEEFDLVNRGLASDVFINSTVRGWITTDGGKVTRIWAVRVYSNFEFEAMIRKIDGAKVTLARSFWYPGKHEESTWTVDGTCKVFEVRRHETTGKPERGAAIKEGLQSDIFTKSRVDAHIITNGKKITEIWVLDLHPRNEGIALVTKVAGNKITMLSDLCDDGESTWTAADTCQVSQGSEQPVPDGLKNTMFFSDSMVMAWIVTDGSKVIQVSVSRLFPSSHFEATIHEVKGNKITLTRSLMDGGTDEKITLTATDSCKVLRGGKTDWGNGTYEGGTKVAGGLRSEIFTGSTVKAHITKVGEKVTAIGIVNIWPSNFCVGVIEKIDGDQVFLGESAYLDYSPSATAKTGIVALSDSYAVLRHGKLDPQTGKILGGEPVAGGLKNEIFADARVMAGIVMEGTKISRLYVFRFMRTNRSSVTIKKVEGKMITVSSGDKEKSDSTLTAADFCKVLKGAKLNEETGLYKGGKPVAGGLKSRLFVNSEVEAQIVKHGDQVAEIHVQGVTLTDEAAVTIKKIDGRQIIVVAEEPISVSDAYDRSYFGVMRIAGKKQPEWTLTATDSCQVIRGAKLNPQLLRYEEGMPVADGLKSKVFVGATVRARIVKVRGKVARLYIIGVTPESEFEANIKKVEGGKITLSRWQYSGWDKDSTWTATATCKVLTKLHFNGESQRYEGGVPVAEGLNSDIFVNSTVNAWIITDGGMVTEVWVIGVNPR